MGEGEGLEKGKKKAGRVRKGWKNEKGGREWGKVGKR